MSEPPMALAYRAKREIEALREPRLPTPIFNSNDPVLPDPALVDALDTLCDAVISLMHRMESRPRVRK